MNHTLNGKSEEIKNDIKNAVEKSKETIKELVASNTKLIGDALETNKKMLDSVKKKTAEKEIGNTITETLKNTFVKSLELSEDTLDSIIKAYSSQLELNLDFNTKLVDALKDSSVEHPEKALELIKNHFEASQELTKVNAKKMIDAYNKHTNLAINFNQKFGESINAQIEALFSFKNEGFNKFTGWASEWWKQEDKHKMEKA